MTRPVSKVLVINDEPLILRDLLKGLNAAARSLDNPFGITFVGALTAREGLALIERDGDVQSVIVDDKLYAVQDMRKRRNGTREPARSLQVSALKLVQRITALRPELDIYILIEKEKEDQVVDALFAEAVDGYFYREERDYRGMYRILNAQVAERARTPFYDALKAYVLAAKDAWHTPGHSSGDSMRGSPWVNEFYDFMGEHVFDADLSVSVKALDSLMEPTGVIAESQQMAAKAFGARRTFFATNGTSTANKVILQTLIAPGEKLLLDRNCHKSVHHGVVLSGARPVYLDSSVNRKYGVFGPVPKKTILQAIDAHPDAELLVLTSCTYDGLRYDLKPIIDAAHERNIKVLIDEAWFAHARFHPALRPTALESGADYATQSAHKTLSALSQAAYIHVNDPSFNEHIFRENFNMHTSTSPMYSMIASLDVSRKQSVLEGYDDGIRLDPTKITVDISSCGMTVDELQGELYTRFNITVEKSTFNTLTLLLTIGTTRSKCSRLYDALMRIAREKRAPRRLYRTPDLPPFTELVSLPRDAYYATGELVPLLDENDQQNGKLAGRVSCDQIVPYPPGIPVLVPGQRITANIVDYLVRYLRVQNKVELHGVVYQGYVPSIRVLTEVEEGRLAPLRQTRPARRRAA